MGSWHVDHEHVDGWEEMPPEKRKLYVRGLLCNGCNIAIGLLQDSPYILRGAATYLEKYSGPV